MAHLRHQNQDAQDQQQINGAAAYNFNHGSNDSFGSYFNQDQSSLFNSPWENDVISDQQIHTRGYVPEHHAWRQNPLQPSSHLEAPNYGLPVGGYGQPVPRIPPGYDYPAFQTQQGHSFSTPPYDSALSYGDQSLYNGSGYGVSRPQEYDRSNIQGQTISPQALQSYPNPYGLPMQDEADALTDPQLLLHAGTGYEDRSQRYPSSSKGNLTGLSTSSGPSLSNVRPKTSSSTTNAANSIASNGLIFFGQEPLYLPHESESLPKLKFRRTKTEIWRKLLNEKGVGEWDARRQLVVKELRSKALTPKLQRTGYAGTAVTSKTASITDSSLSPASASAGKESDSPYSNSEYESEPEENMPLPPSRPLDSTKADEYDIIKSIWAKRRARLTGPEIRSALGDYWNIMKVLRDKWRADHTGLQQAEEKKDEAATEKGRNQAAGKRRAIERSIALTIQHGHRDIIRKLGENTTLLLMFYQLVADCFKEGDYSGTLISNILELVKRFDTVDQSVLEKVKLDKVLSKLLKRGNEQIKSSAQEVLNSATALSKKKEDGGKVTFSQGSKEPSSTITTTAAPRVPAAIVGVKRPRENTSSSSSAPPTKKSSSTIKSTLAPSAKAGTGKRGAVSKTEAKPSTNSTANGVPVSKIKVNHVVSKPTSFFSSLQSASKKPGTSIAAQKSAQQIDVKTSKTTEGSTVTSTTASVAAPKPTFYFTETMAEITKPKEDPATSKVEINHPPEAAEEKAKRLRKEERRKLRVSFKPNDRLVETRVFVHDPEEEIGHDDSMIRDVGDVKGEGQMLIAHKGLNFRDEDEDVTTGEETIAPWFSPSLVDFSVIGSGELKRNCTTRGGTVEVKSHERAVQEQRELTTLMVFYTSMHDIPPSPREPLDPYSGDAMIECAFGAPPEETKLREVRFYSGNTSQTLAHSQPSSVSTADISALLKILNGQQQPQPQLVPQQPATQAPASGLEAIFAQFASGNNAISQAPMAQAPQQSNVYGHSNDLQATLAAIAQQSQPQMNFVAPPPSQTLDLRALLSQIQQPAQAQGYDYLQGYSGENDRKRPYNYDDQSSNAYNYSNGKKVRGEGKKFYGVPRVPCKFWQEGKCKKGSECTFLHE